MLIIILSIIISLIQYANWANNRTYYYYDGSKELAELLQPTIIQNGVFLVMETQHQDLYLADRNTEQMFNRTDVRFFLVQTSPEPEPDHAATKLRAHYQNASLVKTFIIEDFEIGLFDKYPWLLLNHSNYTLLGRQAKD